MPGWLSTRDTVATETPAARAMSLTVTLPPPAAAGGRAKAVLVGRLSLIASRHRGRRPARLERDDFSFESSSRSIYMFAHDPSGRARGHAFRKTGNHFSGSCSTPHRDISAHRESGSADSRPI